MHLMYVDESGDDGFKPDKCYSKGNTPTKSYIRCGIILHDKKWKSTNEAIDGWKYSKKIPKAIEIHATEILNGMQKFYNHRGQRKSRPNWYGKNFPLKNERIKLLKSLCAEICKFPITVIAIIIDKAKISYSNRNYKNLPKERSWEFLIERYNLFLKNARDKKGIIISDAITNNIERENRIFAKSILESSLHVDDFHFIESILFEPSDSSNMLQISDVIAYTFGRKFNMDDSTYYDIISPLLFSQNGDSLGKGQKSWPE